jgi:uncharacterized protein (DUF1778 family)
MTYPKYESKTKSINMRVTPSYHALLEKAAERRGLTITDFIISNLPISSAIVGKTSMPTASIIQQQ